MSILPREPEADPIPSVSILLGVLAPAQRRDFANPLLASRLDRCARRLYSSASARDVDALERVAVPERMVAAAIDDTCHRFDPEVAVAQGEVARQRGRGAGDVDAVVAGADDDVALQQRVLDGAADAVGVRGRGDGDPVGAGQMDDVGAHHRADRGGAPSALELVHADALESGAEDAIGDNQIARSAFDSNANSAAL